MTEKIDERSLGDILSSVRDLVAADPKLRVRVHSRFTRDIEVWCGNEDFTEGGWESYCLLAYTVPYRSLNCSAASFLQWKIQDVQSVRWLYLVDDTSIQHGYPIRLKIQDIKSIEVYRPEERVFRAEK